MFDGYVQEMAAGLTDGGSLASYLVFVRQSAMPFNRVAQLGNFLFSALAGDLRFHDVTFGYDEGTTVLADLNLFAQPGQKIAFVGSTGAGKTTITNLINRFYDVRSGRITYDGVDVCDIQKASLRRSLGIVLQDTHLFRGAAADNSRFDTRAEALIERGTHEELLAAQGEYWQPYHGMGNSRKRAASPPTELSLTTRT